MFGFGAKSKKLKCNCGRKMEMLKDSDYHLVADYCRKCMRLQPSGKQVRSVAGLEFFLIDPKAKVGEEI